ncbi:MULTISPECIES: M14 family metallopeptidase [unclassified Cupriavidus]|uniref:M14 family metallopeptidase n=1 Tax=unclassified Cupriavidus TaxID=2640874 RepID=UPI001C002C33|nr:MULTISPECIES: M14 family metallopeptidase [unclassified Cupriavidus]MCA3182362.1 succinylglutamate desuccinylase/aspartoacylase family protein [Cupriavidus sp.]MCA3190037.1 succinylglutamate desuccinylase/aspartoacylase family protein [Cupriavidus sp.]MCA3197488.1 succinylglutamate desuccinylase/aspartoacylase family protein [Cupriavidus sp.]MCA3201827.1 succinylglutamate desuccinylase/aspartoacylase family protein [Cupriavidus sp.]MCA3210405.1 succinylglutamate desuccinylase/aspartoacylase
MTQTAPAFDAYPVEVEFPDIRPYADGNAGIAYVHTFDSGLPGPHVMINALTHGNEVCGAITVAGLLDHGLRPRRGKLTLAFANVDAYATFDATKPDASRFVDQDFNRVWTSAVLDDLSRDSSELRRARAMRPVIDTVDLLLDLHSMHEKSRPLIVSGPLDKGIALSRAVGAPADIIVDEGHPEGRRMRDYADFGDAASPRNALLIECGQHWETAAVDVARDSTARFLLNAGIVDEADLPAGWLRPLPAAQRVVRVTEPVVASSMDFRFAGPYTGLETFADAGTVIGWRDGQPVTTPYANCVLVMPSLRQLRPGVTVVRLGQLEG